MHKPWRSFWNDSIVNCTHSSALQTKSAILELLENLVHVYIVTAVLEGNRCQSCPLRAMSVHQEKYLSYLTKILRSFELNYCKKAKRWKDSRLPLRKDSNVKCRFDLIILESACAEFFGPLLVLLLQLQFYCETLTGQECSNQPELCKIWVNTFTSKVPMRCS